MGEHQCDENLAHNCHNVQPVLRLEGSFRKVSTRAQKSPSSENTVLRPASPRPGVARSASPARRCPERPISAPRSSMTRPASPARRPASPGQAAFDRHASPGRAAFGRTIDQPASPGRAAFGRTLEKPASPSKAAFGRSLPDRPASPKKQASHRPCLDRPVSPARKTCDQPLTERPSPQKRASCRGMPDRCSSAKNLFERPPVEPSRRGSHPSLSSSHGLPFVPGSRATSLEPPEDSRGQLNTSMCSDVSVCSRLTQLSSKTSSCRRHLSSQEIEQLEVEKKRRELQDMLKKNRKTMRKALGPEIGVARTRCSDGGAEELNSASQAHDAAKLSSEAAPDLLAKGVRNRRPSFGSSLSRFA